jgi:son of sevenless-like protein
LAVPEFDHHDPLSWNKLSLHISICINNLISAAKSAQTTVYKKYAATIVDAVRFMLTASGTISKESVFIKTNGVLRSHHRAMMASMSKIVLSAQLCADGTVTDVTKLVSDCHELLIAVRNFISTCENIHVQVSFVEPVLLSPLDEQSPEWEFAVRRHSSISTGGGTMIDPGIRAKYELESDLIDNLDTYGASMQESIESLMANLTRHSDSRSSLAVLLFTQYRNFGNQTGQFLSIIEDIDFQHVKHSPLMEELGTAKQKLYDGLGHLFFKMQTMTDDVVPLEQVIADMQVAAQSINDAIKLVCERMAALVHERSQMTLVECAKTEDSPQNTSNESIKDKSISEFLADSNDTLANPLPSHVLNMIPNQNASTPTIKVANRSSAPNIDTLLYNHLNDDVEGEDDDDEGEYEDYYEDGDDSNSQEGEEKTKRRRRLVLRKKRAQTLTLTQSTHASAKLKQFFGTDIPEPSSPSATPPTPTDSNYNVSDGYSYLEHNYSPGEIVFTMDGNVKGGTLRALVERMTMHDYLDMNFNTTFLLTYRSFCTSMDLVELLEKRYNIQPPEGLTIEDLEVWTSKKQKLIRLRVFNIIKIWLEQYYYEEDSVILDRLLYFTSTSIKESSTFACYQLERLIHRRKATCKQLKKIVANPHYGPDPILPRNLKKFRLLDLDTIEMARQLTLMDFKLYSSIKPVECLDKAWSRDTGVAANIKASIDYCNQVTTWVSDEILSQSEVKKRSTIIKYWVNVADKCRSFNNFNTCMAILSAFDNSAVGRLKRTWEMVGARTNHIVAHIRKLMGANKNFNQYRALIHSANPPCIPFLGIYLQDLTFVEDGNPNFLKTSKDLINFAKRAKTAEVIRELQQYQSMCYHFIAVDEVQAFITENLHSSRDEDQLYKESLKLEPK